MAETELKRVKLKKLMFNKYDANEVEAYLENVHRKFRKVQLENVELIEKVKELTAKLDSFRDKEESIRNALAMAEKVSTLCIKEARAKAEKILSDAKAQSNEMMANTSCEAIEQKDNLIKLRSYVSGYQKGLLLLFKDNLDSLKKFMSKDQLYQEFRSELKSELCKEKITVEENAESKQSEVVDISSSTESDDELAAEQQSAKDKSPLKDDLLKVNERFKDLKFGKNYNTGTAQKKSFFNMFKKVR